MNTYTCPVCGYPELDRPAYRDGNEPSYDICFSCGYEYGFCDDHEGISHDEWREQWIGKGNKWGVKGNMKWWSTSRKQPPNWNPKKQLENIGIYLP